MNWSTQQSDVFAWFQSPSANRHLIVRARAGTGKSTTIREGVRYAPDTRILIAAFSKSIQLDMQSKLTGTQADVQTLHALGFQCARRFRDRLRPDFSGARADDLALAACGLQVPDGVRKLVAKLHTKGREIAPLATLPGQLMTLAYKFECVPDDFWSEQGYTTEFVEAKALAAMQLAATCPAGTAIDGADMIFLPIRNRWLTRMYDLVVIDEAQDMTTSQLLIARGVLRDNGRICVVGDDRQAIFGFRGADSGSLDRLKTELGAAELNLTTTYRCAKAIVDLARQYVPDFTAAEQNPDGEIRDIPDTELISTAAPGDFILSRTNAPLVSTALQLLRSGKRAHVAGRDIGKGLITMIRNLKAASVPDLLRKVGTWQEREIRRLTAQITNKTKNTIEGRLDAIDDQAEMVRALAVEARSVEDVRLKIDQLFADDGLGAAGLITLSSVHKAKGLEADRVFLLSHTFRDTSQEELNLSYVAITRAKHRLTWVRRTER